MKHLGQVVKVSPAPLYRDKRERVLVRFPNLFNEEPLFADLMVINQEDWKHGQLIEIEMVAVASGVQPFVNLQNQLVEAIRKPVRKAA